MPVSDSERLFRFIAYNDYDPLPPRGPRVKSSCFHTRAITVSMNLESVWDLDANLAVCPPTHGLCSLTAGERRACAKPERGELNVIPNPVDPDPLLGIPNPSHADLSRALDKREAQRVAETASRNVHRTPPEPPD